MKKIEAVQKITRKIWVDNEGRLIVFWGEEPNLVRNILPDLDSAIRQQRHVIEQYHGLTEKIRGEHLFLPGEEQKLTQMIDQLHRVVHRFLSIEELSFQEEKMLSEAIKKVKDEIGKVTNEFKERAKIRLEMIPPLRDEKGRRYFQASLDAEKAALDLLERIKEINEKSWGVILRTRKLIDEKLRIERIFLSVYNRLGKFLIELQNGVTEQRLSEIVNEIVGGENNLLAGLESIKVLPYVKRVQSREIQRLRKLPDYLRKKDIKKIQRTLEEAFKKLKPVIDERRMRYRKKLEITDEGKYIF